MKKLELNKMEQIEGGWLSNRQCMYLGAIGIGFAVGQVWGAVSASLITATVGGCFEEW